MTDTILLVEDNPGDVLYTKTVFELDGIHNPMAVAKDGEEALAYLEQHPAPILILLDINMPKINGYEVLEAMERHKQWRTIPVAILTTSDVNQDIVEKHPAIVYDYLTKPVNVARVQAVMGELG